MKVLVWISRLIVGTLFILSGLIKANDPHGFSYKLEEYFEVFSNDLTVKVTEELTENGKRIQDEPCAGKILPDFMEKVEVRIPESEQSGTTRMLVSFFHFLAKNALFLAIFICVLEIVLGVCTLFGIGIRPVSWLLLGMIVFFTFLTFYSAYFNKVTDCGCFGDALKLTPWQSFWKDVILLFFIVPIWWHNRKIKSSSTADSSELALGIAAVLFMGALILLQFKWWFPLIFVAAMLIIRMLTGRFSPRFYASGLVIAATLISTGFGIYTELYEPVKDYRPWKEGAHLEPLRYSQPDRVQTDFLYIRKSDCELVRKSPDTEGWDWYTMEFDEAHLFWKQDQVILEKGQDALIKDFSLNDPETEEPWADTLFQRPGRKFFVVFHKPSKVNPNALNALRTFTAAAMAKGIPVYGAAAATGEEILDFISREQLPFPVFSNDEKPLKTILRSNPGLVELDGDLVVKKWPGRCLPKPKYLNQ